MIEYLHSMFIRLLPQDEEINQASQLIESLKSQIIEQEEIIAQTKTDYDGVQEDMVRLQVLFFNCN